MFNMIKGSVSINKSSSTLYFHYLSHIPISCCIPSSYFFSSSIFFAFHLQFFTLMNCSAVSFLLQAHIPISISVPSFLYFIFDSSPYFASSSLFLFSNTILLFIFLPYLVFPALLKSSHIRIWLLVYPLLVYYFLSLTTIICLTCALGHRLILSQYQRSLYEWAF